MTLLERRIEWIPAVAGSLLLLASILVAHGPARAQATPDEQRITEAVSPLPAGLRDQARVIGWKDGEPSVVLREPSSGETSVLLSSRRPAPRRGFTCVADDPERAGFRVSCFDASATDYEAWMLRRQASGASEDTAVHDLLQEIETGRIDVPGGVIHRRVGQAASDASHVTILLMPGATFESTGLPTDASTDSPWLRYGGTGAAQLVIPR